MPECSGVTPDTPFFKRLGLAENGAQKNLTLMRCSGGRTGPGTEESRETYLKRRATGEQEKWSEHSRFLVN
ncbi:MAG: hypothetical protein OXC02_03440 [Rhodobacteraceae bacterium]|nr:hypothetical protein [Paracoccaceae bacterium]